MKIDLTDAEEIAIDTLWRPKGFVDARTPAFIKNSRYFQWRINLAFVITVGLIALSFAKPEWMISHALTNPSRLSWINTYVALRGSMGLAILVVGIYCWTRNVGMKTFWRVFTVTSIVMLVVDFTVVPPASIEQLLSPSHISFFTFRLALIAIGLVNVWHGIYAPSKRSRKLLFWSNSANVVE